MTELSSPVSLSGQVAIVTGAGRGLGRVFALALAKRGAKVVINGRDPGALAEQEVADEISNQGGEAVVEIASVSDSVAVSAMVERVLKRWGRIDILVNNAGCLNDGLLHKTTLTDIREVIDSHLIGTINCSHAVWPIMQKQNYGRVVMLTSASGLMGNAGQAAYAAAKMGVIGLMHSLSQEGKRHNIRVNALAPFGITRMNAQLISVDLHAVFATEKVAPGLLCLCAADAPEGLTLMAAGGTYEIVETCVSRGLVMADSAEQLIQHLSLTPPDTLQPLHNVIEQMSRAMKALGY